MANFHSPCQEQRLLLSVFLTGSLNLVVCFDSKILKNPTKTNRQELEREGRKASCQGGKERG